MRATMRRPQQGQERMIATENVQRQIAVAVVVTMKEGAELIAVHREIGGIDIENDARRRQRVLLQEYLNEELLHAVEVGDDLLVATIFVGTHRRKFETVEGAFAGQGLAAIALAQAVVAERIFLADQKRQQRIVPQLVMIVEVFIAKAQAEDALFDEIDQRVLGAVRIAIVGEASGKLLDEAKLVFDLTQQQTATIGSDLAAVKTAHDLAAGKLLEKKFAWATLCHSDMASWFGNKCLSTKTLMPNQKPWRNSSSEKCGLSHFVKPLMAVKYA
jgi:hypothetical protein